MPDTTNWQLTLGGHTLGLPGQEGGTLIRDESLGEDRARLMLEEDAARGFWALTCTVPGWLVHTRYFTCGAEAHAALEAMRPEVEALVLALPAAPERPPGEATREAGARLADFLVRFP